MTESQTSTPTSISGTGLLGRLGIDRLPLLGWAGVAAVLLAEALAVSLRFDALQAEPVAGLGWVMAQLSAVFRGIVFAGIAILLFGGTRLLERYAAADFRGERRISWPYLVGQGAAFAVFFRLSAPVLEGGLGSLAHPGFSVALWAVAGVATLVVGLAAAVPPVLWGPLLKSIRGPAAVGAVVGIAATFVGSAAQVLWEPLSDQTLRLVASFLALIHPVVINVPGANDRRDTFLSRPDRAGLLGLRGDRPDAGPPGRLSRISPPPATAGAGPAAGAIGRVDRVALQRAADHRAGDDRRLGAA